MKNIIFKLACIALLSTVLISCTDTSITPNVSYYNFVAKAISSNSSFSVEMYINDSLFVGYNKLYFNLKDKSSGQTINQAIMTMHPLMDMGTMKHACPWEDPSSNKNRDGLYEGAVLFSMVGTNCWSVSVDVTANGKTETVKFDIPKVIAPKQAQKIVVIDSVMTGGMLTQTKYPISLVKPKDWKVGMNPFEIVIHCQQDMMTFPSCSDFTVEITPEMPSMGHGSPNNVNPVYVGSGHYMGTVNFTMTGAWRVKLVLKKGGRTVSDKIYFDITF